MKKTIAALYVEKDGCYFGDPYIDPWDISRDARLYKGPHTVVAHPPCQRWGRYWHGSTRKPHQHKMGDDDGTFEAAIKSVRQFGGVLEHPADTNAWEHFYIAKPPRKGGWIEAHPYDKSPGFTCCVYQGHYGHFSGKPTWLYVVGVNKDDLPILQWGPCGQRLHPVALEKYGYEKARRIGMMAMVGGKDKTRIRNATPPLFMQLLVDIARKAIPPLANK